jgi:3-methyladenine DNA glycosylase AlkD
MERLKALGTETGRKTNIRMGAADNQFGVTMGELRSMAKELKGNEALAKELWQTGNLEAMIIATLVLKPKSLASDDLDRMASEIPSPQVADYFATNIAKNHPAKESRRETWMSSEQEMKRRIGWSLTTERVVKNREGLDLDRLLDRIEVEMPAAPRHAQWALNHCLAEIGIRSPQHRERAVRIGEKIGAFRDYPVSKGCTSPYAPIWIAEMVKRSSSPAA